MVKKKSTFSAGTVVAPLAMVTLALAAHGANAATDGEGAAALDLDREATLVWANDRTVENLDPDQVGKGFALLPHLAIYDRLIDVDPSTGELRPGLATGWRFDEDNTFLELQLREGVVFHDGEPFDANAVAANLERSATLEKGRTESAEAVAAIGEVEVVDAYTVRLHRAGEDDLAWSLLLTNLSENAGMMISPAAFDRDITRDPVGAGPYRLESFDRDRMVMVRFDDYWDPDAVGLARLEITQPADAEAHLAGIASGQFDLTPIGPSQVSRAESMGLTVQVEPTLVVWKLYFNHGLEPLDDAAVRQAFNYAIDRQAIAELLLEGHATPTPQYFPPDYYTFHPDHGMEAYPYDPERARQILADAGYTDEIDLTMELINTPDRRVRMAEFVQSQMADVGVNIEFSLVEHAAWGGWREDEFHIFFGTRSRLDPLDHLGPELDEDGSFNPGGFTHEELQAMLDEVVQLSVDDPRRVELLQEISGQQTEQAYTVVLLAENQPWAHDGCVVGFEPPVATYVDFRNMGIEAGCR